MSRSLLQWLPESIPTLRERPPAEYLHFATTLTIRTGGEAGALTVAGQWRIFTAFPSILAIVLMKCAAETNGQPVSHGTIFRDMSILN